MVPKPKIDIKRFRPAFIQEAEIAATKAAEEAELPRTCIGYRTNPDKTISATLCGNPLPRHLRRYCSGECMINAKAKGTYRSD